MRKVIGKTIKILLSVIGGLSAILLLLAGTVWLLAVNADLKRPDIRLDASLYALACDTDTLRVCNGNTLYRNPYGIWEADLCGGAVERGAAMGAMSRDLLYFQESVFVRRIKEIISSDTYLGVLHKLMLFFNRKMARYVPEEYRAEIAAVAEFCTHEFDVFGTPYERQLNYHAAHDIGHTMQEYMLVGCSSFAVRNGASADSTLLVGRNFDFYVGDDFARNKLVSFVRPSQGYRYASVGWPGMIGVLSGMNEKGLTVTINAAKGAIPTRSAMPISILARHILQYAATVEEAFHIADTCRIFVSESLLIGQADGRYAAVIEKTPGKQALFEIPGDVLVCTNHYQSEVFAQDPDNRENIEGTDSEYRHRRLSELIREQWPVDPQKAAFILRNDKGLNDVSIGLTNEKSINQYIAHHSVIFKPEQGIMWVSTSPWQSGAYLCYDLKKIFETSDFSHADSVGFIGADSLFLTDTYPIVCRYRQRAARVREAVSQNKTLPSDYVDSLSVENPDLYETYLLQGDYWHAQGDVVQASAAWKTALTKEIPRLSQQRDIEKKLRKYGTR
ncbi:MAG: C45 family peptidase [Bacteroides sp.]|nr:C45 family peptidase [Bacteroides sp.]MCM1555851.1 C45 family peptidase [Bacteroides sp.]